MIVSIEIRRGSWTRKTQAKPAKTLIPMELMKVREDLIVLPEPKPKFEPYVPKEVPYETTP